MDHQQKQQRKSELESESDRKEEDEFSSLHLIYCSIARIRSLKLFTLSKHFARFRHDMSHNTPLSFQWDGNIFSL